MFQVLTFTLAFCKLILDWKRPSLDLKKTKKQNNNKYLILFYFFLNTVNFLCIHIFKFNMSSKRRQKGRSKDFYHISILWFGPDFIDEPWPEQSETWQWWMWAWSRHSFVSMTERACLLPACVSVRMSAKTLKKACLFRLNLTLADANASVCNFLCQFPAREYL